MDTRPIRVYRHIFAREGQSLQFVRTGQSPCKAKASAYVALEEELKSKDLPRTGWRLLSQEDVTHLVMR